MCLKKVKNRNDAQEEDGFETTGGLGQYKVLLFNTMSELFYSTKKKVMF